MCSGGPKAPGASVSSASGRSAERRPRVIVDAASALAAAERAELC